MPSSSIDLAALRDGGLKYLPLATIACFAVTLGILAYVFEGWGLSVIQMAAPGDVLMAGIVLWLLVAVLAALPVTFALIIDLFRRGPVRRGRVAFVAALVTLGAPLWGPWGVAGPHVDGAATLAACSLSLVVLLAPGWSKATPRPARECVAVILTMPLVAWASLALVEISTMVSDKGFARGATVQAGDSAPCAGTLLWLGEKTVVVRCAETALGVRVITPDGLHIHPTPRTKKWTSSGFLRPAGKENSSNRVLMQK